MPRNLSTETFQMDLRSSPSQHNLGPSRSSSLESHRRVDGDDDDFGLRKDKTIKSHKIDLYSIPVFLLEIIVLVGLAYAAYYIHFQYNHEPLISGFYCDDISYRQQLIESKFTIQFIEKQNEMTIVALLLAIPIALIIFCELVNSMFGALKFRQIRALCACCKLHSITRRTLRFSGAYLLGFFILMISCDILANTTGRLRPYFAQECTSAYQKWCSLNPTFINSQPPASGRDLSSLPSTNSPTTLSSFAQPSGGIGGQSVNNNSPIMSTPASPPISANSNFSMSNAQALSLIAPRNSRARRDLGQSNAILATRHWVDLTDQKLIEICNFTEAQYKFQQMAMSWPSFPAAIFTYACLFTASYLSFVATARPFRIITCVLVMLLLLLATVFDVELVKEHYNHWDDVVASSVLSFIVVIFILLVYLNKFRDGHYYANQKLIGRGSGRAYVHENLRGYSNDGGYNLDKITDSNVVLNGIGPNSSQLLQSAQQNGDIAGGSISNNDLAMRYFQIPRANYRGGQRPISSVNQIR